MAVEPTAGNIEDNINSVGRLPLGLDDELRSARPERLFSPD